MSESLQLYLRRCNNEPPEGIKVCRDTVESVLALVRATPGTTAVDIHGDLETGLVIRVPAGQPWEVELAGTKERVFTYTPLPTGQHRSPDSP